METKVLRSIASPSFRHRKFVKLQILSESSRHNLYEAQTAKAYREGEVFQYFLSNLQFEQRASFLQEILKPITLAPAA